MLLLTASAGGCGILGLGYDGEVTYEVAATRSPCTGLIETTCMQVREPGEASWQLFYDSIDGFAYQPGFQYVIKIGWYDVEPVADGSSREYHLIRLVSQPSATQ